ncbi:MAG: hypothetical protein Q9227_002323 [Pyrenula ochraceoflavens]
MPHISWPLEDTAISQPPSPPLKSDSTLSLPRIICLHGGGTNSRIFRIQCRRLRSHLAPYFRLVFPDAPFFSQPGPDVVSVFKDWGPFRSWLRPSGSGPKSLRDAKDVVVERIDESIAAAMQKDDEAGATGPWIGLLGFSQGAKMAASLLLRQQNQNKTKFARNQEREPDYQFAVLLAGRAPLVSMDADEGISSVAAPGILRLPTIHVHGLQDEHISMHRDLFQQSCDRSSTRLVEWDGGHRVPIKTPDVSAIVAEILDVASKTGAIRSL